MTSGVVFRQFQESAYSYSAAYLKLASLLEEDLPAKGVQSESIGSAGPFVPDLPDNAYEAGGIAFEREALHAKLAQDRIAAAAKQLQDAQVAAEEAERAAGDVFECGCCFDDDVVLSQMVQCSEAHLFCLDCGSKNAESILGNRGTVRGSLLEPIFPSLMDCHPRRNFSAWTQTVVKLPSQRKNTANSLNLHSSCCWRGFVRRKRYDWLSSMI